MIALPLNDHPCLEAVSQIIRDLVDQQDPQLLELVKPHKTTASLAAWYRSLPQRDDDGDPSDGPKLAACSPPQRLQLFSKEPNCFERAPGYIAGAELIDPEPVRQLATLETEFGLHTIPLENGVPIVLDPRLTRNGLGFSVAMATPGPVGIEAYDAPTVRQIAEHVAADGCRARTLIREVVASLPFQYRRNQPEGTSQ